MKFISGRCICLQLIILCDQEPYVYDIDVSPIMELASCGSTFTSIFFFWSSSKKWMRTEGILTESHMLNWKSARVNGCISCKEPRSWHCSVWKEKIIVAFWFPFSMLSRCHYKYNWLIFATSSVWLCVQMSSLTVIITDEGQALGHLCIYDQSWKRPEHAYYDKFKI